MPNFQRSQKDTKGNHSEMKMIHTTTQTFEVESRKHCTYPSIQINYLISLPFLSQ